MLNIFKVKRFAIVASLLLALMATIPAAHAQETGTFSNTGAIIINDTGPASPYPSTIAVSGLGGTITNVTVTLNNLSHSFQPDVEVLLVGPTGANVLLMSDVGSIGCPPVTLTFADGFPTIPILGPCPASGTYSPSAGGVTAFTTPAPAGPYGSALAGFNGTDPNGTWSLYVNDDDFMTVGNIAGGWSLTITTGAPAVEEEEEVRCVTTFEFGSVDLAPVSGELHFYTHGGYETVTPDGWAEGALEVVGGQYTSGTVEVTCGTHVRAWLFDANGDVVGLVPSQYENGDGVFEMGVEEFGVGTAGNPMYVGTYANIIPSE